MQLPRFAALVIALVWIAPAAIAPATATAQVPDGRTELAANAALQYWQAFSQLPVPDKEQEKVLGQWNTVPLDDPAVTKLLADSQQSLMFLYRGAALKQCDWGLDYNDGISMLMPQLAKSRDLARIAALNARRAFENGNWKAGRRDMTSMMVLARHASRDPVMIGLLVRLLLEGMIVDSVAPYVPELKASHTQAVAMFDAMPPAVTLEQAIRFEKKWMAGWIVPHLKAEEQRKPGGALELWKTFLGQDAPDSLKNVATLDEVVKLVEEGFPVYDDLARLAALPNDQFDKQYPPFKQKIKAERPLAALLLPSIDQLRAKEQRHQARMAMLLAGIAVAESGPEKLKDLKDPFGAGPFEYKPLDKGFELKSKLQFEGQPVTLTIGK
jgi:hypothetical protein